MDRGRSLICYSRQYIKANYQDSNYIQERYVYESENILDVMAWDDHQESEDQMVPRQIHGAPLCVGTIAPVIACQM